MLYEVITPFADAALGLGQTEIFRKAFLPFQYSETDMKQLVYMPEPVFVCSFCRNFFPVKYLFQMRIIPSLFDSRKAESEAVFRMMMLYRTFPAGHLFKPFVFLAGAARFRTQQGLGQKIIQFAEKVRITSYNVCYTKLLRG